MQCCAPNPSLAPSLPFLPAVSWLLYLLTYVERGDITGEKERRVLGEGTERRKEGRWHGSIPPPPHPAIVSQREEQRSPFCLSSPTVVSRGIRIAQLSPPFFSSPKKGCLASQENMPHSSSSCLFHFSSPLTAHAAYQPGFTKSMVLVCLPSGALTTSPAPLSRLLSLTVAVTSWKQYPTRLNNFL